MRIVVKRRGNLFVAFDADAGDELGVGIDTDGAIGAAVMNLYMSGGFVSITEITGAAF